MFCRFCGTENDEGAKFCRGCGKPIVPPEEVNSAEPSAEETETITPEDTKSTEETVTAAAEETVETPTPDPAPNVQPGAIPYPGSTASTAQNANGPYPGGPAMNGPQPQGYPNGARPYPGGPQQPRSKYSGQSIACMVVGIVAVVFCETVILGIGCGIAAIILYGLAHSKGERNGMLTAGLVTGIVGLAISVFVLFGLIVAGSVYGFGNLFGGWDVGDSFKSYEFWS